MANVVITMKIMPEGPDTDLAELELEAKKKIEAFAGKGEMRIEQKPIGFGLSFIQIMFVSDEKKGSTDKLEEQLTHVPGVNSVEVTDVRRAVG